MVGGGLAARENALTNLTTHERRCTNANTRTRTRQYSLRVNACRAPNCLCQRTGAGCNERCKLHQGGRFQEASGRAGSRESQNERSNLCYFQVSKGGESIYASYW